jgi:hypothetical protein
MIWKKKNPFLKKNYKLTIIQGNGVMHKYCNPKSQIRLNPFDKSNAYMLIGSFQVLDVYSGGNGLLGNGGRLGPWLYIDSSTVDPQTSRKISMDISRCRLKEKKGYELPSQKIELQSTMSLYKLECFSLHVETNC